MPEPEVKMECGLQRSQVVWNWLERSSPATRVEASVRPDFWAGAPPMLPMEHPWIGTRAEAQTRLKSRVIAPPVLPMEDPWTSRADDEFWEELQDKVLMDTGPDLSEVEAQEGRLFRP